MYYIHILQHSGILDLGHTVSRFSPISDNWREAILVLWQSALIKDDWFPGYGLYLDTRKMFKQREYFQQDNFALSLVGFEYIFEFLAFGCFIGLGNWFRGR